MNDILADIILLGQIKELANVVSSLGTKATGHIVIRQAWDRVGTDLRNDQVEDSNVMSHNASTHALALAFTGTTGAVGLVALLTQQSHTGVGQNALTHWESLLIIASGYPENEASVLFAQHATVHLLRHTTLEQLLQTPFIINFNNLLHARTGTSEIDLYYRSQVNCRKQFMQTKRPNN
jgi:hypothetical protein